MQISAVILDIKFSSTSRHLYRQISARHFFLLPPSCPRILSAGTTGDSIEAPRDRSAAPKRKRRSKTENRNLGFTRPTSRLAGVVGPRSTHSLSRAESRVGREIAVTYVEDDGCCCYDGRERRAGARASMGESRSASTHFPKLCRARGRKMFKARERKHRRPAAAPVCATTTLTGCPHTETTSRRKMHRGDAASLVGPDQLPVPFLPRKATRDAIRRYR